MGGKKSKARMRRSASTRGPFFAAHPLNEVPFEIRKRALTRHANEQLEQFELVLPNIVEIVARLDPVHTLALMSMYGLMGTPDQQGNHKRLAWTPRLQQGHVEFLQALFLRNQSKRGMEFPEPSSIQTLFDDLPKLFSAYQAKTAQGASDAATVSDHAALRQLQDFIRAHTCVVRNWGYFGNVTRISRALLSRLDNEYEGLAGMKLTNVVDIFEALVRRHESIINNHLERVHSALSLPTKQRMVEKFLATFKFSGDIAGFRQALSDPGVTYQQAKCALMPWADRFLASTLILTNQEIAEESGLDVDAVAILTNRISLAFADLADEDPKSFFLDNPAWLRPLIYLEKDCYFCPVPQTLLSFVFPIAEELLVPFDGLPQKLSNARAAFLEDEVMRLFDAALPGCVRQRGFKWREGAQQFESDLVVRFDTTIILIEAKSGRISWPALRGAPGRLTEHIKRLIVEPSDQSGRLAQRLEEDIACLNANEGTTLGFPLPLNGVTCVIRLSVMLHDFATIQSVPAMLEDSGALKNKFPLAPCMSLADLEVMLDLLETPYLRLHYLRRRAELLMSLRTVGDELDMLGMYLDTALNLGSIPNAAGKVLINSGYSVRIDRYYSLRDESLPAKKPRPITSQWVKQLCAQLEERARPGWSEIACALLSLSPSDQTNVEKNVRRLALKVKAGKPLRNGQDTVMVIPPESDEQALAFQVVARQTSSHFSSEFGKIAQQAFESEHVKRCVILAVDATSANLSYLRVGLLVAAETSHVVFY